MKLARLLQSSSGVTHPECSSLADLQPTQVLPHYTTPPDPAHPYCAANGSGPSYIQDVVKIYTAYPLHSATGKQLVTPSLQGGPSYRSTKSRVFAVLAPQWWNKLPVQCSRTAESLHIFHRRLKTHLFRLHLSFSLCLSASCLSCFSHLTQCSNFCGCF